MKENVVVNVPFLERIIEYLVNQQHSVLPEVVFYSYFLDREQDIITVLIHEEYDNTQEYLNNPPLLTLAFKGVTDTYKSTYKQLISLVSFSKGYIPGDIFYPEEEIALDESLLIALSDGIIPVPATCSWPIYQSPILNLLLLPDAKANAYLSEVEIQGQDPLLFMLSTIVSMEIYKNKGSSVEKRKKKEEVNPEEVITLRSIKDKQGRIQLEFLTEFEGDKEEILRYMQVVKEDIQGSFSIVPSRQIGNVTLFKDLISRYEEEKSLH